MATARKHHYVPEFLLRHFADPSTGQLHQLDKKTGRASVSNPRDAAQQRDFYRLASDTVPFDPEQYFSLWETNAADAIRAVLGDGKPPTPAQRIAIAGFVWLLYQRGPIGLGRLEATWEVGQKAWAKETFLAVGGQIIPQPEAI